MQVIVSGRQLEISDTLRAAAEEKIGRLSRFLDGMDLAEVHFFEERNPRIADKDCCEVTIEGHGHHVRARVSAPDPFVAVDRVSDKLEQQLYKLKTKLKRRSHPRSNGSVHSNGHDQAAAEGSSPAEEEPARRRPRIVKTKQFEMKPMTPEEAVLQMELVGHDFYFFTSSETGAAAVVYERNDGDVGLIDAAG